MTPDPTAAEQFGRHLSPLEPEMKYTVRIPGRTSWSEHERCGEALIECRKANRINPGHRVYEERDDGGVTEVAEEWQSDGSEADEAAADLLDEITRDAME